MARRCPEAEWYDLRFRDRIVAHGPARRWAEKETAAVSIEPETPPRTVEPFDAPAPPATPPAAAAPPATPSGADAGDTETDSSGSGAAGALTQPAATHAREE